MSEKLFYISFATDEGFRGATVVRADDAAFAFDEATNRGLNPGGEAAILEIPPEVWDAPDVVPLINRLVGRDEMIAMGAKRHGDCGPNLQAALEAAVNVVCEHCNIAGKS